MSLEWLDSAWMYYVWATLLLVVCLASWCLNLFALPGNWGIVAAAALFAFAFAGREDRGIGWWAVGSLVALAALGEVIEFAAGAAGAAKLGGSRRGMALAVVGTFVGSIAGALALAPVPVVGSIVGAVGGGALGAFGGAYLGEIWKGRTSDESLEIGTAAMIGRILGTAGKVAVGAAMVVIATAAAFFD
jgi:uncharacterized protein YqgC (DUF456 family)